MGVFSTNQTRHLYVATDTNTVTDASAVGTIEVKTNKEQQLYFKYMGEGGQTRSDLIDIKNIMNVSYTPATEMQIPLKTVKVKITEGELVVGQDYIIRITFTQMAGMSADTNYTKFGVVRVTSDMNVTKFMETMEASLKANFKREATPLLTFTHNAGELTIQEVEQPWALGTQPYYPLMFEVTLAPVMVNGVETTWGDITKGTNGVVYNGKQIADLEYFCMGERGEVHRGMGYPYTIQPKGLVDSTKEYDTINIHYAYVGSNESVQKSEKDITIVGIKGSLTTLISALETATGLTFVEKQ